MGGVAPSRGHVRNRVVAAVVAVAAVAFPVIALPPSGAGAEAPDGSGTMTVAPTYTINSETGKFFTFTYTAAAGGMTDGEITLVVPAGWTPPDPNAFNPGGSNATCGDFSPTVTGSGPWTFHVNHVTLSAGATCDIKYGISGFGTVTAPAATGTYTFTAQTKSTAGGTLTSLASSPTVLVDHDGTGTMTVNPASALVGSGGNTHTFHYTAARAMSNGELTLQVPGTWSTPSTTGTAAGFTTSGCGTVSVVANTIHVTGINLANGASCDTVYGATSSSGPGATAPATGGTLTFTVQHQSNIAHNNLQAVATSPTISTVSPDGAGTMTVTPTSVITSSMGNFFTFTYTAPNPGGMTDGELAIVVPVGWPAPDPNTFNPGGSNATCGDFSPTVTGSGPWTFHVNHVTLTGGATCEIKYGISGFGTVTAPSSPGTYIFTAQQSSVSTGTLTSLAASPQIVAIEDGTGTMTVTPQSALVGSSGNTHVFTYTAARNITAGQINIAVPAGWSAPSTSGASGGFTTSTCSGGTVAAVGNTIQVSGINMANGANCTITYGSTSSGGPGATAPPSGGANTFVTQQKSSAGGTLTNLLAGSPQVFVVSPDGSGTMTVTPNLAVTSSTGNFFTFTYTAATGGLSDGELAIVVPVGWPAPDPNTFNPGGSNATCGDFSPTVTGAGPWTFRVHHVTLADGATCDIHYGINGFGTVTAPGVNGSYPFIAQEQSYSTGSLTALASSPSIVVASDGTGTVTVLPTEALVSSTGNTLVFTYTAATTVTNGEVDVTVPAGWSAPSITGSADGFTTSTCGTVAVAGNTIQVTGVNRNAAQTCTVTYGDTSSGGSGADAPATGGTSTFTTQQKSTAGGTLTALPTSPQVFVVSADGTGTMTTFSGSPVVPGSTGNALTFRYTAANGSLHNGEITVEVPAGWTAPDPNTFNPGGTNASCTGNPITVTGAGPWTIHVANVDLIGGATCDIHYGNLGFGTVTAPAAAGTVTFNAQEKSTATGTLTSLASSPQVIVGTDGGGTMTLLPTTFSASSPGNTLTFTFTAPVGGLSAGQVNVDIPAGWSTPSTTGSSPGFTTTTCPGGSVAIAGSTIQVSGINLAAAAMCTIVYGATSSGGPGATAPAATGLNTFTTQEKSTVGGTLTNLSTGSPTATVYATDGSGTLTVAPPTADIGSSGNTLVFTYTAAVGGTTSGQITVDVPAGWTSPSTTGSNAGFTQSTCGSVATAGSTIQVSGIALAGGGTCTITYGSMTSGGAGATAPPAAGTSTFNAQEKSTGGGTLTALAASPEVTVVAPAVVLDTAAVSIAEGNTGASTSAGLDVELAAVSAVDTTVHVAITGGSASSGADVSALDMDLTIPAGDASVAVPLDVLGDETVEPDETVEITLTVVSGASLGAPSTSTVTITNDDTATLTVPAANASVTVVEGGVAGSVLLAVPQATQSQVVIELDNPSASDITVDVVTLDGTATAPDDYAAIGQTFTIPAGQTSLVVPLTVVADTVDESDETFTVRFTGATGAVLAASDVTVTIVDDDLPLVVTTTTPPGGGTTPPGGGGTTTPITGATVPAGGLPATGGSPTAVLVVGAILLVLGASLLVTRRRRQPTG